MTRLEFARDAANGELAEAILALRSVMRARNPDPDRIRDAVRTTAAAFARADEFAAAVAAEAAEARRAADPHPERGPWRYA